MNDPARTSRSADLAALAKATDANGNVDLTAFEAQRLIYRHESIDGLDANALVRDLSGSPAFAKPGGKEQMQPLMDAIASRLPPDQAIRFSEALDRANITDTLLERRLEVFSENMEKTWRSFKESVGQVDASVSDALADTKRWAERVRDNPDNSYLERAAANLASGSAGQAQDLYGQAKGASTQGIAMLGGVVDLAEFGARFTTDRDFRNLIIGAGLVYASETYRDPSKPVDDVRNVAVNAWNEWQKGLKEAQAQGKEQEYLGEAKGAVGIELLAAIIPATKLAKLGKIANAVDAVDDAAPDMAGQTGRRVAGEATELLDELVDSARRAQKGAEWESDSADLMFSGLAGVKRSQGELRELVDDMRAKGQLDGLLGSGALNLRELNYLARQDVSVFDGNVPFDKAIEKWVGDRKLSELTDPMVGDLGEAIVAHKMARQGYSDLVPIQNNSGHGNDLAGINPETGRWEVFEIKASVQGIARRQGGDPDEIIVSRLEKADAEKGLWAPKNMWEEQAAATARRLLDDFYDDSTRKLDIDPKWVRVNIERDADGRIVAEPEIEKWKTPQERQLDRQKKPDAPDEAAPQRVEAPADITTGAKATTLGVGLAAASITRDEDARGPSLAGVVPLVPSLAGSRGGASHALDDRDELRHDNQLTSKKATDAYVATASLPPDFAPSLPRGRDLRDPEHPGHEAFKEMCHRVKADEARHGLPSGAHSECRAAATLHMAVENGIRYQDVYFKRDAQTGEAVMLNRRDPSQSENECPRFSMNLRQMSSQPIDVSSQQLNEALSRHYATPEQTEAQIRTQAQSQALAGLCFDDQVMFARVRGNTPGHVSDEHVMQAMSAAKAGGIHNASEIGSVMMLGDQLRVASIGESGKAVMVDVTQPAPSLQASVEATNTINQQQALILAQQQSAPTQDETVRAQRMA